MDRGAVPRTSTNKNMKLLKINAEYYDSYTGNLLNVYYFKYNKVFLKANHVITKDVKSIVESSFHFLKYLSSDDYNFSYYYDDYWWKPTRHINMPYIDSDGKYVKILRIENKISNNNYSKRKLLKEIFHIYEIFEI